MTLNFLFYYVKVSSFLCSTQARHILRPMRVSFISIISITNISLFGYIAVVFQFHAHREVIHTKNIWQAPRLMSMQGMHRITDTQMVVRLVVQIAFRPRRAIVERISQLSQRILFVAEKSADAPFTMVSILPCLVLINSSVK